MGEKAGIDGVEVEWTSGKRSAGDTLGEVVPLTFTSWPAAKLLTRVTVGTDAKRDGCRSHPASKVTTAPNNTAEIGSMCVLIGKFLSIMVQRQVY